MNIKILFCSLLYVLLISCKKTDILKTQGATSLPAANFSEVFESFWQGVNNNYLYWQTDTTNWDNMYIKYKPLFAGLDLNNSSDVNKSISYFKQMTIGLMDSHFQIIGLSKDFAGINIFPAYSRKESSTGYHDRFDYTAVDDKYFDNSEKAVNDSLNVITAIIQSKILYFSCNEFSLRQAYLSNQSNFQTLLDSFFTRAALKTTTGIIIDLRNNFGGNLADLNFFVGHFIDKPLDFGFSRYKSSAARLDYTPWIKTTVTPASTTQKISCPAVVLADNYTVSVAEAVAMCMHLLPHSVIVGEQTWGATGPIGPGDIFNAGTFQIGNILAIHTSSAEFKYIDGKIYENVGFKPDVPVPFNIQLLNKGVDPQLEKAISLLN